MKHLCSAYLLSRIATPQTASQKYFWTQQPYMTYVLGLQAQGGFMCQDL